MPAAEVIFRPFSKYTRPIFGNDGIMTSETEDITVMEKFTANHYQSISCLAITHKLKCDQ